MAERFTEVWVEVGDTRLLVRSAGTGTTVLVLHGVEGDEGWLAFHDALAERHTVLAPSHPGYGHTACPEWITTIHHQAIFYHWYLRTIGLSQVTVVGVGMGGWIAAEMAVMNDAPINRLILVGSAGVKPERGEIADVFVLTWPQVVRRAFHNPASAPEYQRLYGELQPSEFGGTREAGRTMSTIMCFKPYMYDRSLPAMLPKIQSPTLVLWGDDDQIMPIECGQRMHSAIAGSTLETIEQCGHWAHLEQPQRLAERIHTFVDSDQ